MKKTIEKIKKVLRAYPEIAFSDECLEELSKNSFLLKNFSRPFNRVQQLETLKFRHQSPYGETIPGMKDTIDNLTVFNDENLKVIYVTTKRQTYSLYTDEKIEQLIGIMIYRNLTRLNIEVNEENVKKKGLGREDKWYDASSDSFI